ncbi:hypothetical protein ACMD2_17211 [Ananas comosus]|uniref:PX domain-containing protein n=1 Tax=Ananas comosus TaxID=4615 RepID=A0A199UDQ5_ANACO|nr:hypothetical protein ACMD2_17211 [Ananas comosus]
MPRNSPPKHRHDGTSPLPLGMDWSPPPKRWDGRNTIWPHNPQTGWSYSVMIPSWIVQTEPGASHDSFLNPIVFYRIHIGIQSPEGVSSSHGVLRRFSDFLKLYSALKKSFPKKEIPPAPPKHSFLRINSSRLLLEECRKPLDSAAEENEIVVFHDWNQHPTETSSSRNASADFSTAASNSLSVVSDVGSDNSYETTEVGTPRKGNIQSSETSEVTLNDIGALGAVSNGIMEELVLDKPDEYINSNVHHINLPLERDKYVENNSNWSSAHKERLESTSEQDHDKFSLHARKNSSESIGSDASSIRGTELSIPGFTNSIWDGSIDLPGGAEASNSAEALIGVNDEQIILPLDQRHKLIRLLLTMQRRVVTAKTDMEDLIARLNQEMAVKEYLSTKVKDLEVELEVTKQKSKETLEQAILVERERVTQMQWDMDELRRKYLEMESNLKFEQNEKTRVESEKTTASGEKEMLLQELDNKQEEIKSLQKHLEEVEMKSKADVKVLVKEVKSLRNSQAELKQVLNRNLKEKTDLERVLHNEKQRWEDAKLAWKELLRECRNLRGRLQECSTNFLSEEDGKFTIDSQSLPDALDLLATSDNRIGLLLAEAQLIAQDNGENIRKADNTANSASSETLVETSGEDPTIADGEMRKLLTDIFIDNALLRKQLNSVMRCALNTVNKPEKEESEEAHSRKTVLNRFLER